MLINQFVLFTLNFCLTWICWASVAECISCDIRAQSNDQSVVDKLFMSQSEQLVSGAETWPSTCILTYHIQWKEMGVLNWQGLISKNWQDLGFINWQTMGWLLGQDTEHRLSIKQSGGKKELGCVNGSNWIWFNLLWTQLSFFFCSLFLSIKIYFNILLSTQ